MTNPEAERVHFSCSAALTDTAEREAARLKGELIPVLPTSAQILHVGATSVPDCLTKGDLDLVVRVDGVDFPRARDVMDQCFTKNLGSVRDDHFASYAVDGRPLPIGIQLVVRGCAYDDFHVFWERLRASPSLRADYNALKRQWEGGEMEAYRAAKSAFIDKVSAAESAAKERP